MHSLALPFFTWKQACYRVQEFSSMSTCQELMKARVLQKEVANKTVPETEWLNKKNGKTQAKI